MTTYCETYETGYDYDRGDLYTSTYLVVEGREATEEELEAVTEAFYAVTTERYGCELPYSVEEYREMVAESAYRNEDLDATFYEVASNL